MLVRVLRSKDRVWRVEYRRGNGIHLIWLGFPILRGTEQQIRDRLAQDGVRFEDLVED